MTNSALAVRRGTQTPRVANYPPYRLSAAPEVIDLAATAGLMLDEWQRYVLTHGLGSTADGRWTANRVSVWVPRQNGKGGIIEALELAWLFLFEEELIVHSAHQHRTAARAYDRLERMIRSTPDLHRRVRQYRQANGEQQIELHDGRMLQYTTRSRTAVRGFTTPKLILDEAQELTGEQMAAMLPTVSAMPNWQVWFYGTPPDSPAAWAHGLRDDGEEGVPRLAHFDWGLGTIPDDPVERARLASDVDARFAANPAAGIRVAEETMEDEARPSGLGVDKFLQERLGMWHRRATAGAGVIDQQQWEELADAGSRRAGQVAVAVDVAPDRGWAAIGLYGPRGDGFGHVQVLDYRPGTEWIVPRLVELRAALNPIAVGMARGTYASLKEDLRQAGMVRPEDRPPTKVKGSDDSHPPQCGDLAVLTAVDMAAACGQMIDAVRQATLRQVPSPQLDAAVSGGKTRRVGDTIAWSRKSADVDITPLVAVTEARWAYLARVDAMTIDDYDPVSQVF